MKANSIKIFDVLGKFALVTLALVLSTGVFAQGETHEVAFDTVTGSLGDTVTMTLTFTNTGGASAVEARARVSDMAVFDSVDVSGLCASIASSVDYDNCGLNDTNRIYIGLTNFDVNEPVPDFTGTVEFNISASATAPQTIDVVWNAPDDAGSTFTPTSAIDGAVEITAGPTSELTLSPDPMAFGTVDLGNMPATDTFTVENVGAADANISAVALAGPDGEFTILADNCSGSLTAGSTCTVDIEFNAAANGSYTNQLDITSDANVNPNPSAAITGSADSVADLSVNPPFGAVNLGTVVVGSGASASGSVSNAGSADGDFSCSLSGDPEISVTPSPLSGTVPAGGSTEFTISCDVPDSAAEGDTFTAGLSCTGDNGFEGSHEISCSATEFVAIPVPTMNKWGIALLALLMVMIGGISVRFFRT